MFINNKNNAAAGVPAARFWRPLLTLATALTLSLSLYGQSNTGKILGNVTDASGAVIAGAKLTASSPNLPTPLQATTDGSGVYIFPAVPPGTYAVSVTKEGFRTARQQNVSVLIGSQVDYNPRLEVGQVAEVVEVSESVLSIDLTSTSTATIITSANAELLPRGRSFNSLLQMAPGTRREVKAGSVGVGGYQIDGASGSENVWIIDGAEVSDVRRGSLGVQKAIPFELVEQTEVKSNGFRAEYGGAMGGVITVATKSGSNDFHGDFSMLVTSDLLNPTPRGWYQRAAANSTQFEFFKPREDGYNTWYPGGRIGGPFIKNKLFFSTGFFPTVTRTERTNAYASGTRVFTRQDLNHFWLSRVDYAPTSRLQMYSSWTWSPQRISGLLPNVDPRIAAPSNDLTVQGGWTPSQTFNYSANYQLSSNWLVQGRVGYNYQNDKGNNYGLTGQPFVTYSSAASQSPVAVPAEVNFANGYSNVSSTLRTDSDVTTRRNLYLDSSYFTGKHNIRFGYNFSRLSNEVLSDFTNGRFQIFWGQTFSRGSVTNQAGTYGYYVWQDGVRLNNGVNSRNQGYYVQDTWRVSRRLTLELGMRFENEFLPPYTKEFNGVKISNPIDFGWKDKIAPRLGAAWDITGTGKWKLAGSFGLFYDTMKYELARGSFGGDYWWSHVYKLNSPNVFSLGKTNPGALGDKIISYNNRTIPINAAGELEGIDPDIKPQGVRRFNVSLEHQLASRMTFAMRYTRSDVTRGIEDIGVLDENDDEVYLIGNPGFGLTRDTKSVYGAKTPNGKEFLVPKATRQYDAVEFRIQGQANSFTWLGSYTLSRLWGNWSGLANSDEAGRSDPGVSRAFDLPFYYFDASGSQENAFGRLATDRPHEFKIFGAYTLKTKAGASNFALNQAAWSGSLDSTSVIYQSAPTYPYGRGDLGRTPFFLQTDFFFQHKIKMGEKPTLSFEANIINLMNQAKVIARTTQINNGSAISAARLPLSQFFAGYNVKALVPVGGTAPPYNPIYGLPGGTIASGGAGAYQAPREIRLGIRFQF